MQDLAWDCPGVKVQGECLSCLFLAACKLTYKPPGCGCLDLEL